MLIEVHYEVSEAQVCSEVPIETLTKAIYILSKIFNINQYMTYYYFSSLSVCAVCSYVEQH